MITVLNQGTGRAILSLSLIWPCLSLSHSLLLPLLQERPFLFFKHFGVTRGQPLISLTSRSISSTSASTFESFLFSPLNKSVIELGDHSTQGWSHHRGGPTTLYSTSSSELKRSDDCGVPDDHDNEGHSVCEATIKSLHCEEKSSFRLTPRLTSRYPALPSLNSSLTELTTQQVIRSPVGFASEASTLPGGRQGPCSLPLATPRTACTRLSGRTF